MILTLAFSVAVLFGICIIGALWYISPALFILVMIAVLALIVGFINKMVGRHRK